MDNDHDFILPEIPDLTPKIEDLPKHTRKFEPDYKYVTKDVLKNITVNQLAKIEAELHNLRLIYVANGENPNMVLANGRSIIAEINSTIELLNNLSEYFEAILDDSESMA